MPSPRAAGSGAASGEGGGGGGSWGAARPASGSSLYRGFSAAVDSDTGADAAPPQYQTPPSAGGAAEVGAGYTPRGSRLPWPPAGTSPAVGTGPGGAPWTDAGPLPGLRSPSGRLLPPLMPPGDALQQQHQQHQQSWSMPGVGGGVQSGAVGSWVQGPLGSPLQGLAAPRPGPAPAPAPAAFGTSGSRGDGGGGGGSGTCSPAPAWSANAVDSGSPGWTSQQRSAGHSALGGGAASADAGSGGTSMRRSPIAAAGGAAVVGGWVGG